jgi:hypothetical protein
VLDTSSSPEEKAKLGKHKNKKRENKQLGIQRPPIRTMGGNFLARIGSGEARTSRGRGGGGREEEEEEEENREKRGKYFIMKMNDENVLDWNLVH